MEHVLHVNDTLGGQQSKAWVEHFASIKDQFTDSKHTFFILRKTQESDVSSDDFFVSSSKNKLSFKPLFELIEYCKRNEVTVLQPHTQKATLFSLLAKLWLGKKVKLIIHEHGAINPSNGNWYPFLLTLFDKWIAHYIAVSQATKKKLLERTKISPEKVSVIYNFVNLDYFHPGSVGRTKAREQFNLSSDGFILGFVGRLNAIKNLITLIEALPVLIKTFPNMHVVLAGGGPLEQSLKQKASELGIGDRVHFLGKVTDMPALYSAIDINMLISYDENLSKVLLEAAAMHVYSIVTDVGGNTEVINPQIGRVLKAATDESILTAIQELQQQPKQDTAFSEVLEKFSIASHIHKTEELYGTLKSKRKKVCFVSLSAHSVFDQSQSTRQGGAEIQMYLLAKEIAHDGEMDVAFIIGDTNKKREITHPDFPVLIAQSTTEESPLLSKIKGVWVALKRENADMYLTTTKSNVSIVVALFCILYRKKHIHRTANQPDVDESYRKWPIFKRILYQFMIRNASTIIVQHKEHQELLKKNYRKNSVIVKNGFDLSTVMPTSISQKQGVLWVGRNVKAKQPDIILSLAQRLGDVPFIIICNTSENPYIPNLKEQCEALPNVHFLEYIPLGEIQDFFSKARVFVSTSIHEGFPNTFIQAGLSGTPIISLNVNPNNMFDTHPCGIYTKGDFDLLERSLDTLLTNDTLWNSLSKGIVSYVQENHDIKKNSKILIDLLKSDMNSIELFRTTKDKKHLVDFYNNNRYNAIYTKLKPKWKEKFKILPRVMNLKKGDKVLDVGSAAKMFKPFVEATGAVYSSADIAAHFESDFVCNAETLEGIPNDSFDWVVLSDILEHVEDPTAALKAALRVGRNVIAVVPNWYRLERFGPLLPRDPSDRHLQKLSPTQWLRHFHNAGWKLAKMRGFFYVPSLAFYPFKVLKLVDKIFLTLPFRLLSKPIDTYLAELPVVRLFGQELIIVGIRKK